MARDVKQKPRLNRRLRLKRAERSRARLVEADAESLADARVVQFSAHVASRSTQFWQSRFASSR